ncbi:tRNA lysidine(34) synthetase TilS [Orbaceae bacterium ESL0727]|nr:tRNA lysidine(34) synthetase TilS [Orbaceae bacterium ESL0727]
MITVSSDWQEPIWQTVSAAIQNRTALLVAYSGGIDSTVLLHTLTELKQQCMIANLRVRAIYIHHGLSPNADEWAKHCQAQCQRWQIPFIIEKVQIDKSTGNIEEQARNARYAAIARHLNDDETLCTAQHLDDQCETFLLALKRGSGPAGLAAMAQERISDHSSSHPHELLRPLLTISRQQIEDYATRHHLTWIEDESNQDDHYDRNFLRLTVIPKLTARWPHFSQMVARSSELCRQQEQLLEELLWPELQQIITTPKQLPIALLRACSDYKRNALLRLWLKINQTAMPSLKQLALIWQTVALAQDDANPAFILADKQIRRYQDQLYLLPHFHDLKPVILSWDLLSPLVLPDQLGRLLISTVSDKVEQQGEQINCLSPLGCRRPKKDEQVTVRFHAQGRFHIVGRSGSRTIKKLWQEHAVPPWMRSRIPLIFYNEQLIAAVNCFVTTEGEGNEIYFLQSDHAAY